MIIDSMIPMISIIDSNRNTNGILSMIPSLLMGIPLIIDY